MLREYLVLVRELRSPDPAASVADWTQTPIGSDGASELTTVFSKGIGIRHENAHRTHGHNIHLAPCSLKIDGIDHCYEITRLCAPKSGLSRGIGAWLDSLPLPSTSALVILMHSGGDLVGTLIDAGFKVLGSQRQTTLDRSAIRARAPIRKLINGLQRTAIVMGRPNPNMLAQMRALGRCGIKVDCIVTRGESPLIVRLSRFSFKVHDCRTSNDAQIVRIFTSIREREQHKPVLFFAGDYDITLVARLWPLLRDVVIPVSDPCPAASLADKSRQLQIARDAGIPVPPGANLRTTSDLENAIYSLRFPLICRPSDAQRKGRFSQKLFIADSASQLRKVVQPALQQGDSEIVIQEFIPGGDKTLFFALAACTSDGRAAALLTGRKVFQYPDGLTCIGETIVSEECASLAAKAFEAFSVGGVLGVEFKFDERRKIFYFIETNFRPDNFVAIAEAAGCNLMLIAYLQCCDEKPFYRPPSAAHAVWHDTSVVVLSRLGGKKPPIGQLLHRFGGKRRKYVDAVWCLDDPLPGLAWYVSKLGRYVAKRDAE